MNPAQAGVLTGPEIRRLVEQHDRAVKIDHLPRISITPFNPEHVGPNSYDVTLAPVLRTYISRDLDMRSDNPTIEHTIPESGMMLYPGELYLGSIVEKTVTSGLMPWLDGRSGVGRLGMKVHITAGKGDDGFGEELESEGGCSWTLEIEVTKPLRVYAGVKIAQLFYFTLVGERQPYHSSKGAHYGKQSGPTPSKSFHS